MSQALPNELELHQRLLNRDETASAELFARYMNWLVDALKARYPRIAHYDETLVKDAVSDALFSYIDRPETYNPELKGLKRFLYMSANGDLLNLWRKVQQRTQRETSLEQLVELGRETGNMIIESPDESNKGLDALTMEERWQQIQELVPDERDLQVIALMSSGVRKTKDYAEALGITELPEAEQSKR
ncbi:MAG: hypothetical protein MN733_05970, partial [Nitrososphaera sp.]|nr:hypothetical protein [Nitrososphaera sp.]